ncbi:MAG: hypothetical protein K2X38_13385 [Gemmataceae bacterium]|nr:hypothetical protein [Gemmataceae bacterium]
MEPVQTQERRDAVEGAAHFSEEAAPAEVKAWEEIEAGRYMPRRTRGSFKGRALG